MQTAMMHANCCAKNPLPTKHGQVSKAKECHELKEQQKVNASQANFHEANTVLKLSTVGDNLAMTATTDLELTESKKQLLEMNTFFQRRQSVSARLFLFTSMHKVLA